MRGRGREGKSQHRALTGRTQGKTVCTEEDMSNMHVRMHARGRQEEQARSSNRL